MFCVLGKLGGNDENIKEMQDTQKLGVLERKGKIVTNIKEDAYARHKQTQTANFAAYQTEAQEHVGVAGAEGLGKMGSGNGGELNGGGMNPAAMMAGMVVGGALGQNIAGNINNVMGNATNNIQTPPPITPSKLYNVAVNGQPTGPFDLGTLGNMVVAGQFLKESLVWAKGMSEWKRACEIEELSGLFTEMPPIPPTE